MDCWYVISSFLVHPLVYQLLCVSLVVHSPSVLNEQQQQKKDLNECQV